MQTFSSKKFNEKSNLGLQEKLSRKKDLLFYILYISDISREEIEKLRR